MINAKNTIKNVIKKCLSQGIGKEHSFLKNQYIINYGDVDDRLFLITQGVAKILVPSNDGPETEIAVRYEDEIIGEVGFLSKNSNRTASVRAESDLVKLISISREDIIAIISLQPEFMDAVSDLWQLNVTRKRETEDQLLGRYTSIYLVCSVCIFDIHSFSEHSTKIWEENINGFLFEFIIGLKKIARQFNAEFFDQGDGAKVQFVGIENAVKSVAFSIEVLKFYIDLRARWASQFEDFQSIGLGCGIVTDLMNLRRTIGSHEYQCVLGNSINLASLLSKFRHSEDEVGLYVDRGTIDLVNKNGIYLFDEHRKFFEKIKGDLIFFRAKLNKADFSAEKEQNTNIVSKPILLAEDERVNLLLVGADPHDEAPLRVMEEMREIESSIRESIKKKNFNIRHIHSMRKADLVREMLEFSPHVIHFSGHGNETGDFLAEGKDGKADGVSASAIARLFDVLGKDIQVVVLNSCFSGQLAEDLAQRVPALIAMDREILDAASIEFSSGFYQALSAGKSIRDAYETGKLRILLAGYEDEEGVPKLYNQ